MKRTGSETRSGGADSAGGNEVSAEIIERARLQADVAQQRVRLAKDELRRARKRLKEAKREAKRTRKLASATRKVLKRALRKAEKRDQQKLASATPRSGARVNLAPTKTAGPSSRSPGNRRGRTRARAGK